VKEGTLATVMKRLATTGKALSDVAEAVFALSPSEAEMGGRFLLRC
jgi:hypothetical protein